jgi:short-subunit dehydrogenase involved in D-alanine esterification of teichoic acids
MSVNISPRPELRLTSLQIPQFVSEVLSEDPDVDCVFVNSGIQRPFKFTQPETVDLDIFDQELVTNYTAPVHLTKAFLPHLQKQKAKGQTAIVYTSSQLALIPMTRAPNYGASKAALHHFVLALRSQLSNVDGPKVIELFPPAVQTELHDTKHQPDLKDGHLMGMPLDEYINETWTSFVQGEEQIAVGGAKEIFDAFEPKRQEIYHQWNEQAGQFLKKFLRE